jgi:hypothetical protein
MRQIWLLLIGAFSLPLVTLWLLLSFAPIDTRSDKRNKVADDDKAFEFAVQHLLTHAAISSAIH